MHRDSEDFQDWEVVSDQLISVTYDWGEGIWLVIVSLFGGETFKKAYGSEEEANQGMKDLLKSLASVPSGDVLSFLINWRDVL